MSKFLSRECGCAGALMSDDLFSWEPPAAPFQKHSPTSIKAAEKMEGRVSALHRKILAFLADCPNGATDEQMQLGLSMNPSTQRPRRIELCAIGKIVESGTRPTRSGRSAVVWRIAP